MAQGGSKGPGSVLLADSHALFRTGIRYLLQELSSELEVVEARSRAEALGSLETHRFDLILASLFSSEGDSVRFVSELLRGADASRVMFVSGVDDPGLIRAVLTAGAAGYLLKDTAPEITLQAIRLVLAGGTYIPPAALGSGPPRGGPWRSITATTEGPELTERQRAVLHLLAEGAVNKRIARETDLSPSSVKAHVANLLRIFGASNRTELVIIATRCSALSPPVVAEIVGERVKRHP